MNIEAPLSKYKKSNIKILIFAMLLFGIWFGYDGYFSKTFIEEHTVETEQNGVVEKAPDDTLVFNRKAPIYLSVGVLLLIGYLYVIKDVKITANENELVLGKGKKINYDSIQSINKTFFESKGYFIITYQDEDGKETDCKLTDKKYDNLSAVLDHLITKIS